MNCLMPTQNRYVPSEIMAVRVWEPGLTNEEAKQIERVQKSAFYIIMGDDYVSYSNALEVLGWESLEHRRGNICLNVSILNYKVL